MTVQDCLSEISNLTIFRGAPPEAVEVILTNDLQLWQFASQLIEQELVYMKAVEEGYDKDDEVVKLISKERDNQLSQLYMQEKVADNFAVVTDEEKRKFFNENRSRIQAAVGRNVTYEQVAMDIETTILQERMRNEYDKIIAAAQTNYNLKYSVTSDPCITIDETTIPLSEFNDMFNESIKQAGANIPAALRMQAKEGMFKAFVAREVMMYEAKKTGFYDTPQAKAIENFLTRSAVTANFIDKTIRSTIPKPTEEEINLAYEQYGKMYNIDSLPYADAQKALETMVIEAKTQQKYQILVTDLRYRYNIEKNLDGTYTYYDNTGILRDSLEVTGYTITASNDVFSTDIEQVAGTVRRQLKTEEYVNLLNTVLHENLSNVPFRDWWTGSVASEGDTSQNHDAPGNGFSVYTTHGSGGILGLSNNPVDAPDRGWIQLANVKAFNSELNFYTRTGDNWKDIRILPGDEGKAGYLDVDPLVYIGYDNLSGETGNQGFVEITGVNNGYWPAVVQMVNINVQTVDTSGNAYYNVTINNGPTVKIDDSESIVRPF